MGNKRLLIARLLMSVGAHRVIARFRNATLIVLNFHRIRASRDAVTMFDDGVFETDVDTFRDQMTWLRNHTKVLDEKSLLGLLDSDTPSRGGPFSLVTIDDGYIDCYTLIRPVLEDVGIRAIFFVPAGMIESRTLGWWDQAAFMLKKCEARCINVRGQEYALQAGLTQSLRRILNLFKLESADRTQGLLDEISRACNVLPPTGDQQSAELMGWSQIRELRRAGHAIGSHAWSHRVLTTLGPGEQVKEILESNHKLCEIVGEPINSFAYPVGGPQHYDRESIASVRETGHRLAFTFNTGVSELPVTDRFQIPRESASTLEVLKAKTFLPWVAGIRRLYAA